MARKSMFTTKARAILLLAIPVTFIVYDFSTTARVAFRVAPLRDNHIAANRFPVSVEALFNAIFPKKEAYSSRPSPRSPRSKGDAKPSDTHIDNSQSASKSSPVYPNQPKQDYSARNKPPRSRSPSEVLIVVLAIPGYPSYSRVAAASHRAYAARHGYRLVVQTAYLGSDVRYHNRECVSMQKLLACRLAQKEKYVLILDYDVVIAPWTPPLPHLPPGKVGIVDEAQPSAEHIASILKLRNGNARKPEDYYSSLGFPLPEKDVPRGILNTGVMLVQPAAHAELLESMYEKHVAIQRTHQSLYHYEQAMIGHALLQRGIVHPLHHAWNRNWVWYNWSAAVGLEEYGMGDVFRRSYFMHYLWAKQDMLKLENWMKVENITFAREYPIQLDLLK